MADKETVLKDFIEMVKKSWTYNALSEEQRKCLMTSINNAKNQMFGTYEQRWKILNTCFISFLDGVSSVDDSILAW